jgi:hypothetical protein
MDPRQPRFTVDLRRREVSDSPELVLASDPSHKNSLQLHVEQEGLAAVLTAGTRQRKVVGIWPATKRGSSDHSFFSERGSGCR